MTIIFCTFTEILIQNNMDKKEIFKNFGIDPETIGHRYRGYWILDKIEEEEEYGNAQIGFLCVKTRDGGSNPIDVDSIKIPNCVGTSEDGFDCTYRYYYFKPI